jgi:PhnB protein
VTWGDVSNLKEQIMATARRIPEGHEGPIAYLTLKNAAKAIDFYKTVFGATELMRLADQKGRIGHAELRIGKGIVMLADEFPEFGRESPRAGRDHSVGVHLYVEDVDAVFKKALNAGAKDLRQPTNEFYGDRAAKFEDPFGHHWMISTHVEDVGAKEMQQRFEKMMAQQHKG